MLYFDNNHSQRELTFRFVCLLVCFVVVVVVFFSLLLLCPFFVFCSLSSSSSFLLLLLLLLLLRPLLVLLLTLRVSSVAAVSVGKVFGKLAVSIIRKSIILLLPHAEQSPHMTLAAGVAGLRRQQALERSFISCRNLLLWL